MAFFVTAMAISLPVGPPPPYVPNGFDTAHPGARVTGPQVVQHHNGVNNGTVASTVEECAKACLDGSGLKNCIAFNWIGSKGVGEPRQAAALPTSGGACELSSWGPEYLVMPNQSSIYYSKTLARNDTRVAQKIPYLLEVPKRGVVLTKNVGSPFATAFEVNLGYLDQLPVDDMLYWFRHRAGVPNPVGATSWGWDGAVEPFAADYDHHDHDHHSHHDDATLYAHHYHHADYASESAQAHLLNSDYHQRRAPTQTGAPPPPRGVNIDGPFGLRGSIAGAFMMGSGGATRWVDQPELRAKLEAVVNNISSLQAEDGFAMAFPKNETNSKELPDYTQSWVTHGLLEADAAGVAGALAILRKHFDWYNYATDVLAEQLPPLSINETTGLPPQCSDLQRKFGHCVYLIYQGMIHNTRLAGSDVGTARDLQVVQELYQEDWWLARLAAKDQSAIWERQSSHNYEITAFEAYTDMYVMTGEQQYLDAMEGAWGMIRDHWVHVGGSIAINEGGSYPPASYYLGQKPTGELCGSSFWIRFNQRFHRLRPEQEVYVAEIERSLFNVILASQAPPEANPPGIRYFAQLEGTKANPTNIVTCCESQGTRTFGALPEFIYSTSTATSAVYVNLFVSSTYVGDGFQLVQTTGFPSNGTFSLAMLADAARQEEGGPLPTARNAIIVMLRIPSWCQASQVAVVVKDVNNGGSTIKMLNGYPGTFLELELAHAQVVTMHLPMALRTSLYNGTQPTPVSGCTDPADAVRAVVEWGPILLAATHSSDPKCRGSPAYAASAHPTSNVAVTIRGVDPRNVSASTWLHPAGFDGVDPLFTVDGTNGCTVFKPYYSLNQEAMSVYPVFLPAAGKTENTTCGIAKENYPAETSNVCVLCPAGKSISAIANAQFGVLNGTCATGIVPGGCTANASNVKTIVEGLCLGSRQCSVPASFHVFGNVCTGVHKSLTVSVECNVGQCDEVAENWPLETTAITVGCPGGQVISSVVDAQFGLLTGSCAASGAGFKPSGCTSNATLVKSVVASLCVGNQTCTVPAQVRRFGADACPGKVKTLAVRVGCTASTASTASTALL